MCRFSADYPGLHLVSLVVCWCCGTVEPINYFLLCLNCYNTDSNLLQNNLYIRHQLVCHQWCVTIVKLLWITIRNIITASDNTGTHETLDLDMSTGPLQCSVHWGCYRIFLDSRYYSILTLSVMFFIFIYFLKSVLFTVHVYQTWRNLITHTNSLISIQALLLSIWIYRTWNQTRSMIESCSNVSASLCWCVCLSLCRWWCTWRRLLRQLAGVFFPEQWPGGGGGQRERLHPAGDHGGLAVLLTGCSPGGKT